MDLWIFIGYVFLFCLMALYEAKRSHASEEGFFLNARRSSTVETSFSLIASCVGGSATIGMCGLAYSVGLPAFWWLGSGAVGLIGLTIFLSRKVRRADAVTMPEMIRRLLGELPYRAVVLIIAAAWVAILAAQFVAMSKIVELLTGFSANTSLIVGSAFIVFYTMIGGQAGVIRSDVIQYAIILVGLIALLFWTMNVSTTPIQTMQWEFVNESFTLSRWSYFVLLMGGSYVVCPMLFTRMMSAKNEAVAYRSGWIAAVGIALTALLIVFIGVQAQGIVASQTPDDMVLMQLVSQTPLWMKILLLLALMSAVVSSADSCLVTVATIVSRDGFGRTGVGASRLWIAIIGVAGIWLAAGDGGILGLLLTANNIYVCAVVCPVFIALVTQRRLAARWTFTGIVVAAFLAGVSELTATTNYSYWAMGISIVMSLTALWQQADKTKRRISLSNAPLGRKNC